MDFHGESGRNVVLRTVGEKPTFSFPVRDHVALGEMQGMINQELGAAVAGAYACSWLEAFENASTHDQPQQAAELTAEALEDLCVLAITARAGRGAAVAGRTPGLPDSAYESDGQITRRELRALAIAMLVHIWKSLPFWTLILVAGRLAIPSDQYEAASVDGASSWQKFRFITWPSMKTLYLTSTLLSMIWTLGDFNSVYLLTGGGPADLTHVLATLGIRYLRLDQVDLAMASIVVALPLVLPLVYFMMKRLSK